MASTTTMTSWIEQLAVSLIPPTTKSTDVRKYRDSFARKIKHHTYGRTNQFAVAEKLTGLEEKLQVLNLDDVAEEIYARRMELSRHDERWIPDALDLLLHLSHKPIKYGQAERLEKFNNRKATPPPLKWADIEADDPIDHQDSIWRIPEYSDLSSDEDDIVASSVTTSPASVKQNDADGAVLDRVLDAKVTNDGLSSSLELQSAQFWNLRDETILITERQAVREALFMLIGLPTAIFTFDTRTIRHNPRYRLGRLEKETSNSILGESASLGSKIVPVRQWVRRSQAGSVMQLIQSCIQDILADFERGISLMQHDMLRETSPDGVVTLMQTLHMIKKKRMPLNAVSAIIPQLPQDDPVAALNTLHEHIDFAYTCFDTVALETLLPIFLSALRLYAKPLDRWLRQGKIESPNTFFISEKTGPRNKTTLWHDWYSLSEDDNLTPSFLKKFTRQIFATGKTAAFLHHLQPLAQDNNDNNHSLEAAIIEVTNLLQTSSISLSATLEAVLDEHLRILLATTTSSLKHTLNTNCGLTRLLDAFDCLYLAKDGAILDTIETRTFSQIDRCAEIWNDRFLVAESLTQAYQHIPCIDAASITIESSYTSSRSMEARRRSVKILGSMTLHYHLPWAVANIIPLSSIVSYQRIALTLAQMRRAKYVLERRAYWYVGNIPLGSQNRDQRLAQTVYAALAGFVNILYAHITACTIEPMTRDMRLSLIASATGSVDDMIAVHGRYIRDLELACLCSPRVKPLRDAMVSVLDLCIRFADLVSMSSPTLAALERSRKGSTDCEASSFISARSQRQRRRRRGRSHAQNDESSSSEDDDEDEDGDGMGEGYSTFILVGDTTVVREIATIREEFNMHVPFLMAGLRGVARSSREVGEGLELLADSLDGLFPRKRDHLY
ncbi:Spc98 family-domain-containing protein [Exophiala viscosa]|uniref:Spindle pole body component n=1 Tax=Exophiala viscosa TaxID=2486360 RepID=A0AAN6E128_9EURO|nr:Spc98 family-domain-containing protein [Exophiala viscosa]